PAVRGHVPARHRLPPHPTALRRRCVDVPPRHAAAARPRLCRLALHRHDPARHLARRLRPPRRGQAPSCVTRAGRSGVRDARSGHRRDDMSAASTESAAVVVGAGPNGLTAAVFLARAGRKVVVFEANATPRGGCRSAELTAPGFVHDVCSSVHPTGVASPAFAQLPLANHGVAWAHPEIALAHPLDGDRAGLLYRSLDETAQGLGPDADAYRTLMRHFAAK